MSIIKLALLIERNHLEPTIAGVEIFKALLLLGGEDGGLNIFHFIPLLPHHLPCMV